MLDTTLATSSELPPWPLPPGCPADELAQVLSEHDLLDVECTALIDELRSRRQAGQPLQAQARALAQRLSALQGEHQVHLVAQLDELRALQDRSAARLHALQQRVNQDAMHLQG